MDHIDKTETEFPRRESQIWRKIPVWRGFLILVLCLELWAGLEEEIMIRRCDSDRPWFLRSFGVPAHCVAPRFVRHAYILLADRPYRITIRYSKKCTAAL